MSRISEDIKVENNIWINRVKTTRYLFNTSFVLFLSAPDAKFKYKISVWIPFYAEMTVAEIIFNCETCIRFEKWEYFHYK